MILFKKLAIATALGTSLVLVGCFSSSDNNSSGSSGSGGEVNTASIPVTGVAAKGILQGALVQACSDTNCADVLATGKTDKEGFYTLDIPNTFSGVAVIKVSYQDSATMICDSSDSSDCGDDFGKPIAMEESLALRSAASIEKSATKIEAHVSPLTELVVTAAAESRKSTGGGSLNLDSINKGSQAVKDLLGLDDSTDIIRVKPIDITNKDADVSDETALQLTALSAAFASKDEGKTIADKIAMFSDAVSGGSVSKKDLQNLNKAATGSLTKAASNNTNLSSKVENINKTLSAASEKATKNCGDSGCSVTVEVAEVDASESTSISNNVAAVKTLVADIRALGWEVYPALRDAADPTIDGYSNNLIGQADDAAKIVDAELQTSFDGVAELLDVVSFAYLEGKAETNINTLAKAYYEYANKYAWEYSEDYKDSRDSCLNNSTKEECNIWHPEKNLADDAQNFAAQFEGSLSKSGKVWTVANATYTKENKKTTISRFELTFPTASPNDAAKSMDIGIKATAKHASSELTLDATAKATFSEAISINEDANFFIETASINGDAKIVNTKNSKIRTFTGKVTFEGGTPNNQQELNKDNADKLVSFLPKYASLEGKFTSSSYPAGVLEAKVTARLDNYETYSYHAEGTPVDVPVKLKLSEDKKSLTLLLGTETEGVSFTTAFKFDYGPEDWATQHGIKFSKCTTEGKGKCTWATYNNEEPIRIDWNSTGSLNNNSTVLDALNVYFDEYSWNSEYFFWNQLYTSKYGYVKTPIIKQLNIDDFDNNGVMQFNAIAAGSPMDTENNYIQGTVTAEVTGKLSANLPDVNLKLTAKRSEFSKATADLVVNWTQPNEAKKVVSFKADLLGNKGSFEKLGDDALKLYVSDAKGTQFLLSDQGVTGEATGYIMKDGTKYATISKNGGMYYVTYHFDSTGKKNDSKSELEFETIF